MTRTFLPAVAVGMLCLVPGTSSGQAAGKQAKPPARQQQTKEVFRWKGKADALFVRSLSGSVAVVGVAAGNEIEIVGTARWKDGQGDPAKVKVEAVTGGKGVTVCTLYLDADEAKCGPDGRYQLSYDGKGGGRDGRVAVDYAVKLPRGAHLDAEVVNGDVVAAGLAAGADVEVVNGQVSLDVETGDVDIEAVNGEVRLRAAAGVTDIDVESVNGAVTLELPKNADAEVSAETVNGDVEIAGTRHRREARVTLGKGGRRVDLETVNGAITVSLK